MMGAHSLVRLGYSWESVAEMDDEDVIFWLDRAKEYNKLTSET
jgi:hypothetical protein